MVKMIDLVRERNNEFWDSVRKLHLEGLLDAAYADPEKRRLIERWLDGNDCRRIRISQTDFDSDPLVIELGLDGYDIRVGGASAADVEVGFTHLAVVGSSTDIISLARAWVFGRVRVKRLLRNARDNCYAGLLFLS